MHVLVGENAGLLNEVLVWLNEGLAVYVECQLFPEAKSYWDTTFAVSRDLGRLLPWDDVTTKSTGEYPVAQARVHYAQSYGLVSGLIRQYGVSKVAAYVQSFRVKFKNDDAPNLAAVYQDHFKTVFGFPWAKGLDVLKPASVTAK